MLNKNSFIKNMYFYYIRIPERGRIQLTSPLKVRRGEGDTLKQFFILVVGGHLNAYPS